MNDNVNTTEEERQEYKLFVKKRLYQQYDMEGDDQRKDKLEELFEEEVNEYKRLRK